MSLQDFIDDAISPWLNDDGEDHDIVISSRIRLARNLDKVPFPTSDQKEPLEKTLEYMEQEFNGKSFDEFKDFQLVKMSDLEPIQKQVLIEKHLISPNLAENNDSGAALISENEQVSIMINEEDHLRLQIYYPGLQLKSAMETSFEIDDWIECKIGYAFVNSCLEDR